MDYDAVVLQVLELLQREKRLSYRVLKRRFGIDDNDLEDLKEDLIYAKQLVVDEEGRVLIWTGASEAMPPPASQPGHALDQAPLTYTPSHLTEKILASRAALEGERKQVTILFADLKDSTELIRDLDPEAAQQLLDPALRHMMEAVHRYEGTVNHVLGDGIMALFGAPIAHEDHAIRACYAALAMQAAMRESTEEVRRAHGLEMRIRVGLNSGEVVVRSIGNDLHMDYSAVGQTTHLAARGEKALARSAYREAAGSFEQALSAVQHLPEQRDTREQAIDLRLALRSALRPLGEFGRILAYLHEAESLAATLDDPRRLGRISIALVVHFVAIGAYDQASAAAQRGRALATASGDVVLHALANSRLGQIHQIQGDYRRGIDCLAHAVAFFEGARRHERFGLPNLPAVLSRAHLTRCHAELGTFPEGSALGEEGLRIAEAVEHSSSLLVAYDGLGFLALRQGDLPRALPLLERAMSLCQEADFSGYFPIVATYLGAAYTLGGRVADAVPLLTRVMELTTATEMQALCRLSLGAAQVLSGRLEDAYNVAERALAHARGHQERGHEAYALRLLGEIAARHEPPESASAEAHYRQALALADELGMRPLVAHCHHDLGTLYAKLGQQAQSRAELTVAIDLYRAMEMIFWLPQAEAALAQVEHRFL